MSKTSLHEELKSWLIEIGKSSDYLKSYSGDSKWLNIQFGKWQDVYQPDVIWKYRGGICVFEIAFTEGWREVAGEICLASMVEDCTQIFIISQSSENPEATEIYENRWKKYVSMIGKKVGLKYGAELTFILYTIWKEERVEEIKKVILNRLKKRECI